MTESVLFYKGGLEKKEESRRKGKQKGRRRMWIYILVDIGTQVWMEILGLEQDRTEFFFSIPPFAVQFIANKSGRIRTRAQGKGKGTLTPIHSRLSTPTP